MKYLRSQQGFALISFFALAAWIAAGVCVLLWVAEIVGYKTLHSNLRYIAIPVAAGVAVPGYLFGNLRDLRKQVKDDAEFLSKRQVANLNHIITLGNRKAIGMLVLFPVSGLFIATGFLLDVESGFFKFFISGFGFFTSLCIASIAISTVNLWEIARFEEKMSNEVKRHKKSVELSQKFRKISEHSSEATNTKDFKSR